MNDQDVRRRTYSARRERVECGLALVASSAPSLRYEESVCAKRMNGKWACGQRIIVAGRLQESDTYPVCVDDHRPESVERDALSGPCTKIDSAGSRRRGDCLNSCSWSGKGERALGRVHRVQPYR